MNWITTEQKFRFVEIALLVGSLFFLWMQIEDGRDTAKRGLRAYVAIVPHATINVRDERVFGIPLSFVNFGQTPAYRITYDVRAFDETPDKALSWQWQFHARDDLQQRLGLLAEKANREFPLDSSIAWDEQNRGGRYLYVVGVIYYDDVYERPHWVTFCVFWPGLDLSPDAASYCDRYNETDETMPTFPVRGPLNLSPSR